MSMQVSDGHGIWRKPTVQEQKNAWRCGDAGVYTERAVERYTNEQGESRTRTNYKIYKIWEKWYGYKMAMSDGYPPITSRDRPDVYDFYLNLIENGISREQAISETYENFIIPKIKPIFKGERIYKTKNLFLTPNFTEPSRKKSNEVNTSKNAKNIGLIIAVSVAIVGVILLQKRF